MPNPMPDIAELLGSLQFGGADAPPLRAGLPARAPAPAFAQTGPAAPGSQPGAIEALLAQLGAAPAAAPVPVRPALAAPRSALPPALDDLIGQALAVAGRERQPRGVWASADTLDALGADPAALPAALAQRGLHAAANFDGRGGILIAPSPDVLRAAERSRERGKSVPIIPVRAEAPAGPPAARGPAVGGFENYG